MEVKVKKDLTEELTYFLKAKITLTKMPKTKVPFERRGFAVFGIDAKKLPWLPPDALYRKFGYYKFEDISRDEFFTFWLPDYETARRLGLLRELTYEITPENPSSEKQPDGCLVYTPEAKLDYLCSYLCKTPIIVKKNKYFVKRNSVQEGKESL